MQGTPYQRDHERSSEARFQGSRMPRTLDGSIRWLLRMAQAELPTDIHTGQVWRDRVTTHEFEQGVTPVGGSHLGSLAWNGLFRVFLEGSPSHVDEDGFYLFPLRSGISRLHRRWPFMARTCIALIGHQGDWRALASRNGWHEEMAEVYIGEALRRLWAQTHDQTVKRAA